MIYKIYTKIKDLVTRTPLKTGVNSSHIITIWQEIYFEMDSAVYNYDNS